MAKLHEVKPGFEKEFDLLVEKKNKLAEEKDKAVSAAIAKVNEEFIERENTIQSLLSLITTEVEVADEVEAEVVVEDEAEVEEKIEEVQPEVEQPQPQPQPQPQAFSPNNGRLGF